VDGIIKMLNFEQTCLQYGGKLSRDGACSVGKKIFYEIKSKYGQKYADKRTTSEQIVDGTTFLGINTCDDNGDVIGKFGKLLTGVCQELSVKEYCDKYSVGYKMKQCFEAHQLPSKKKEQFFSEKSMYGDSQILGYFLTHQLLNEKQIDKVIKLLNKDMSIDKYALESFYDYNHFNKEQLTAFIDFELSKEPGKNNFSHLITKKGGAYDNLSDEDVSKLLDYYKKHSDIFSRDGDYLFALLDNRKLSPKNLDKALKLGANSSFMSTNHLSIKQIMFALDKFAENRYSKQKFFDTFFVEKMIKENPDKFDKQLKKYALDKGVDIRGLITNLDYDKSEIKELLDTYPMKTSIIDAIVERKPEYADYNIIKMMLEDEQYYGQMYTLTHKKEEWNTDEKKLLIDYMVKNKESYGAFGNFGEGVKHITFTPQELDRIIDNGLIDAEFLEYQKMSSGQVDKFINNYIEGFGMLFSYQKLSPSQIDKVISKIGLLSQDKDAAESLKSDVNMLYSSESLSTSQRERLTKTLSPLLNIPEYIISSPLWAKVNPSIVTEMWEKYKIAVEKKLPENPLANLVGEYPVSIKPTEKALSQPIEEFLKQGKFYTKKGDTNYAYYLDDKGKEKIVSIGKVLSKSKKDDLLKEYSKSRQSETKYSDIKLVISQTPDDVASKSTGHGWTSCETIGGQYGGGEGSACGWADDIKANNAIAYLVGPDGKWIGRSMIRWCNREKVVTEAEGNDYFVKELNKINIDDSDTKIFLKRKVNTDDETYTWSNLKKDYEMFIAGSRTADTVGQYQQIIKLIDKMSQNPDAVVERYYGNPTYSDVLKNNANKILREKGYSGVFGKTPCTTPYKYSGFVDSGNKDYTGHITYQVGDLPIIQPIIQ